MKYSTLARTVFQNKKTKNVFKKKAMLEGLESRLLMAANTVSIAASDASGDEAGNTAAITITRTGDTTNPLTVFYTRAGTATVNADYTLSGGTLTSAVILAGQTSVDVTITPKQDAKAEPNETVIFKLTAKPAYDLDLNDRTATVTIADDEPVVSIEATDDAGDESGDAAVVRIERTGDTTNPLTVFYKRAGTAKVNSDYTTNAGTTSVVIPAGQAFVDITITPVQNLLAEAPETVIYKLTAKSAYNVDAGAATDTVTITDDEPVVTVTAQDAGATETQTGETADAGVFRISRSGATTGNLVVKFKMAGTAKRPTDYVMRTVSDAGTIFKTTQVVIPDGASFVDVFVTPVDDALTDPAETAVLTLAKSTTYNLSQTLSEQSATIAIADNEPVVSVAKTKDASEVNPGTTGKGVFTFTRTGLTTGALTVNYTVTGTATVGDDYAALSGTVEIPAGKSSVTVDVTAVTDDDIEGETVIVTINTSGSYTPSVANGAATMSIKDTPISAASLFGDLTFTQNGPINDLTFQKTSTGTFTSTNGRTGSYSWTTWYLPGQGKRADLMIIFSGQPTLSSEGTELTFTSSRPDSLNGRTIQFKDTSASSSGSFDGHDQVLIGLNPLVDVDGFFKLI